MEICVGEYVLFNYGRGVVFVAIETCLEFGFFHSLNNDFGADFGVEHELGCLGRILGDDSLDNK